MKRLLFLIFFCFVFCFLGGCHPKKKAPPVRVVTGVSVTSTGSEGITDYTYTRDEKMESLLNYLRLLDPYITTGIAPDTFRSDTYEIIVTYSDGNHTTYRQIYNDYLQTESGAWKKIDPKQGAKLSDLLHSLPSDGI